MVRQCCVCKILDYKEEEQHLSFIFPVDPVQRNIWLSLLAFEANYKLSKQAEVRSNHFQQSDIECSSSGIRRLRKGAVPLAKHSLFIFPENLRLKFDDLPSISGLSTSLSGTGKKASVSNRDQSFGSSSSAITASETENQPEPDAGFKDDYLATACKNRKRRYVGDLSSSDFSTPEKAKKNFRLMKNTITALRNKSHNLHASNTYFKKKIKTLGGLMKLLKEKSYNITCS
ncbi:unnamed protein product [Acanthoscelides obtectus]|uniref:THAP-type domain-containing protein n=1 Tax=Acanthoscelides obtectus TaxID=200917 RepID=A0A9P0M4I1_ACAOB|nr:unnamed protein product [Acanthoscelides obtectus]CAK1679581.1 hypothetical protein AOBTE_LOCUS32366 [Acanthoscelides obtectus]